MTGADAYHGEGPVWYAPWGGLRWVDMLAGDVLSLDAATGEVGRQHVGEVAAALRPRRAGGMVMGVTRGFALVEADGQVRSLGELWTDPSVRMNEGGCDPDGRFWCGSMGVPVRTGSGAVYRLDPDGSTRQVFDGVTISNGLAWSPDGGTAYYVDSPTQRIDAFDYDRARGLTDRRPVVRVPAEQGTPDGLTVDADGYLWLALYGGSAVHRYAPDGRLDGVVEVPVRQVTACTFGGAGGDELYITTSRENLPDPEPAAGAVFVARPGVRGLPVLPFAG
ncbi:MAG TPA: SMP-30/gluconolactonase/LRE family protein [Rugosimonospora sp.]|nr:SMP-30/gluconolactonase/LRE family protein [Rugosimonospora sp.]